jgi:serine/threonine-protein kinase
MTSPNYYIQHIGEVSYRLKSPFDFSFLKKYGAVFKVFDDQDSGNICFGAAKGENEYFVKFAGAPTARGTITAEEAIANLKNAVPVYQDLAHHSLIKLVDAEEIGGGFAMIFEWVNAECACAAYPQSRKKFMRTPIETRIKIFEDIMDFHAYAAKQGYVAIDFYDGSIMYDFENKKTLICDIDFYQKSPYVGRMGLWGSTRFISPEEREDGAVIDEVTNVYTMGATAFALFSDSDRTREKWPLGGELYNVVKKAVSDAREQRQQSITRLIEEWKGGKLKRCTQSYSPAKRKHTPTRVRVILKKL